MAQSLWFNDFPLTSDKFHSQYLPTFVFQSWTFAFWIKYLCPAWHITAPTIWDQNWVPYRCQQIKYCNCYGGELLLLLSRIGIFSLVMARSVVHGEERTNSDEIIVTFRAGPRLVSSLRGDQRTPEVCYYMDEHCNDTILSAMWPESDAGKTKHSIIPN